jgi:hypothetical protein
VILTGMSVGSNIAIDMKTISVSVSEDDYEYFRMFASRQGRPIAQLLRDAMSHYRATVLAERPRLTDLPVLSGHRPISPLPPREELYDEIFAR